MAISYPSQTPVGVGNSDAQTTIDITYTVPAGTGLLLLAFCARAGTVSSVEDWTTTSEPFVGILTTAPAGANDPSPYVYGIVNPTAKTNTITITWTGSTTWQWATMMSFAGNDTTDVATAVNVLQSPAETFSTTTAFTSAGTAGRGLVTIAGGIGDDKNPASINNSFVEILDGNTGGGGTGNADCSYHVAYLLNDAPSAPTITWSANDWQAGVYLEIVPAASDPTTIAVADSQIIQQAGTVSYTAASGSNRLLVIALHGEDDNADFSPQYGGVSFTDATTDSVQGDGGTDAYVGYILEADIPSGANDVTAAAYAGGSWTTNSWAGAIYTLTNVRQGGQPDPAADEVNQSGSATSHTTGSVTSVTDGILIATFAVATDTGHDTGATITGYTHLDDVQEGGGSWITGYKLIETGASETATFDWNANNQTGASILVGFAPYSDVVNTTIIVPTGPIR